MTAQGNQSAEKAAPSRRQHRCRSHRLWDQRQKVFLEPAMRTQAMANPDLKPDKEHGESFCQTLLEKVT
jgi:hypothetical protein